MPEVARNFAFASALLMMASFAIWAHWLRGPLLQRLDGQIASNAKPAAVAMKLLLAALAVSAAAAVLAIGGWIFP
jgi:hypothetical protein